MGDGWMETPEQDGSRDLTKIRPQDVVLVCEGCQKLYACPVCTATPNMPPRHGDLEKYGYPKCDDGTYRCPVFGPEGEMRAAAWIDYPCGHVVPVLLGHIKDGQSPPCHYCKVKDLPVRR